MSQKEEDLEKNVVEEKTQDIVNWGIYIWLHFYYTR